MAKKEEGFSVDFDWSTLTLGEVEEIEEFMGRPYAEVFPPPDEDDESEVQRAYSAKQQLCIVFLAGRRNISDDFSFDDARKVKITSLRQAQAPKDESPPAPGE